MFTTVVAAINVLAAPVELAIHALAAVVEPAVGAIAFAVQALVDTIAFAIQTTIDAVALAIQSLCELVATGISGAIRAIVQARVDTITLVIQALVDAIALVVQALVDAVAAIVETFLDAIAAIVETLLDTVTRVGKGCAVQQQHSTYRDKHFPRIHAGTPCILSISRVQEYNGPAPRRLTRDGTVFGVIVKSARRRTVRRIIRFFKTTAIGGLLVIVPIAIILFVLAQLLLALYTLAQEVTSALNIGIDDALVMALIALAILIGLCFVTGLIVRTRLGAATKSWFGKHVASRIPMYNALSNLTQRVFGLEGTNFAPVEIDLYGSGTRSMGFLIEELPEGRCAVFVPTAPVATIGNIYLVDRRAVTPIQASMTDTVAVITQWGVDAGQLYDGNPETGPGADAGAAGSSAQV